jgi:uncharacterized protein (TIGR00288 family)
MDRKLALFIDFENIARGVRQQHLEERVDLRAILAELEEKGRILVKRAYADWGYFKDYRSDLLQQGIEPVQVFAAARDREGWKNGADIRIAIDAIETAFRSPDITDFVLVTGDSDFLSLVNRLRENGKVVWGIGLRSSSSQYLIKSCDHFVLYEDIADCPSIDHSDSNGYGRRDSRQLLLTTLRRMSDRQGLPGMPPPGTPLKATAVKSAMRRIDPSWDESFEGHTSFREFVQAHEDIVCWGRPGDSPDFFLAERGTAAESNLHRMLDFAQSGLPAADPAELTGAPGTPVSTPANVELLPRAEVVDAIRDALRTLGATEGDPVGPQRFPVRGAQLKERLQRRIAGFDEAGYGFTSFLDFLLSMRDLFRVVRAEVRGEVLVAERESPADISLNGQPEATSGGPTSSWPQSPENRYLAALCRGTASTMPSITSSGPTVSSLAMLKTKCRCGTVPRSGTAGWGVRTR